MSIDRVGPAYPDALAVETPARSLSARHLHRPGPAAPDLEGLVEMAIRGLDELLGYHHVALLLVDESGRSLYTIASRGFDDQKIGAEVALGDGPIGGRLALRAATHRRPTPAQQVPEAAARRTRCPVRIEKSGRGRFALDVHRPLRLEVVDDARTCACSSLLLWRTVAITRAPPLCQTRSS
jgi:hypothetical protein